MEKRHFATDDHFSDLRMILLDNSATKKLKDIICTELTLIDRISVRYNHTTCDALIENPTKEYQLRYSQWASAKNAITELPSLVVAPIIVILLDRLSVQFKHYLYFLTPVGVAVSGIVLSIGYNRFTSADQVIYSLIPIGVAGGYTVLTLMAFVFEAYETMGKPGVRIGMFVFLQATIMFGKAFGSLLLVALEGSINNMGFCILSTILASAGVLFVALKTRIKLDDFELILAGLRTTSSFKIRCLYTFLLFLCSFVYYFTAKAQTPNFGAVSNSIQASGLLFVTIYIQVQLRNRIVKNKLLAKYEAPMIGIVGWATASGAKLIFLIPSSRAWAPYVASAVNVVSQLSIAMTQYLFCLFYAKNPGFGLLFGTFGSVLGTVPSDAVFIKLSFLSQWRQLPYLVEAVLLLVPLLIFVHFFIYYKSGKGAPKEDFGDEENAEFFRRDLGRNKYGVFGSN